MKIICVCVFSILPADPQLRQDGFLSPPHLLFLGALMFALLVKIYIKQGEIQENQAEILKKLKEIEPKEENKQE